MLCEYYFSVVQSFFGGGWEVKQAAFDVWVQQFSMKSFYKLTFFFFDNSLHTMYKLFLSAVEYLPFSSGDASKACFEEIIERFVDPGDICCHEIHQASYFFYHSHRYVLIFFLSSMQGAFQISTNKTQQVWWGFLWCCTSTSLAVTSKGNGYSVALLHTTTLDSRLSNDHWEASDSGIDA